MDMREVLSNPIVLNVLWQLFGVLVAVSIAVSVSHIIEKRLQHSPINPNARTVLAKCLRVFLLFVTVPVALSATGTDVMAISVFSGALGVSLGWGMQRIVVNYVGGLSILLDQSVRVGDVISVANHQGMVQDFRMRYLLLHKLDGTDVMLPNELLLTNPVVNYSRGERKTLLHIDVPISPESNLEQAMALMLEVAQKHAEVLNDPAPRVLFIGISELGFSLSLEYWIQNIEYGVRALQSTLYFEIWSAFKLHGIEMPFISETEAKYQYLEASAKARQSNDNQDTSIIETS